MTEQATKKRRDKGANGMGGYTRDGDGWLYRKTVDGQRIKAKGKTQEAALANFNAKVDAMRRGVTVQETRQKVADYLSWWLEDVAAPRVCPKTIATYRNLARLHLIPTVGHHEMARLSAQHVTAMMRQKERQGLSARTVCHLRGLLFTALNDALRLGIVERNVVALTDAPKKPDPTPKTLTMEQAQALLAAAEGDRMEAAYRIAVTLGLRRGEVLGLRWQDIDLEAGTLRIAQTVQRQEGKLAIAQPKTPRSRRTVALTPALVASLRAHRDRQAFERSAAGTRWQDTGLVFTTPIGTATDPDNFYKAYRSLVKRAGLPPTTFHQLRHTAITLMIAAGLPVTEVSAVVGHAQTSTTLNVYASALPGANDRVAETMARLLG